MMKKITFFFLAFLTMSWGYSQCTGTSSDVQQGTFTYDYDFSTSGTDVTIKFTIIGGPFVGLVGQLKQGTNYTNMTDLGSQVFEITLNGQTPGAVLSFEFFGPYAAGGVLLSGVNTYTVGDNCVAIPPGEDVSLSDLQLDGATIAGFSSSKITYNIELPDASTIPQVTLVTTTNTLATVGTITQASAIPGSATFDVTSQDMTVNQTYTVNFLLTSPQVAAPTPPARTAADVVAVYSDAYPTSSISPINYDQEWCGGPAIEGTAADGDPVIKYLNQNCQGIGFETDLQDLTGFTHVHIDLFIKAGTDLVGKVFNMKIVPNVGAESEFMNIDINGLATKPVPGTWYSFDAPITFSGPTVDIKQFGITSNLNNSVWYDNLYFHKNTTLGTNDFEIAGLNVYPNPTQNSWTVRTKNIKMSSIQVFDILGKQVLTLAPNAIEAKIDASGLKSGLYFAKINTANGSSSLKLVRQ